MALLKTIKQEDGVTTSYHRVSFVYSRINHHISIGVLSYIDADSRLTEKNGGNPYKSTITYEKPYEENMEIEDVYAYLKTLEAFKDAEDI